MLSEEVVALVEITCPRHLSLGDAFVWSDVGLRDGLRELRSGILI